MTLKSAFVILFIFIYIRYLILKTSHKNSPLSSPPKSSLSLAKRKRETKEEEKNQRARARECVCEKERERENRGSTIVDGFCVY